jgi:potassium uptake TrkH family protein
LIYSIIDILILIFIIQELLRWFIVQGLVQYLKERWFDNLLAILLLINVVFPGTAIGIVSDILPQLSIKEVTILYFGIIQSAVIFAILMKTLRYNYLFSKIKLHPGAIFALSFAFLIISGSFLLMLPKATPQDNPIEYIDALFTSTSAVCVTGLVVVDTAKDFAPLGKVIILFLIQVGGLGVMTLTTFFASYLAGGVSIHFRLMMKDMLSSENIGEVTGLLLKIVTYTFIIEFIGAILLYFFLVGNIYSFNWDYIFSAIFHSISAFCNAGFSLYSQNLVNMNYYFSSVVMILIVLGGLGFTVLANITDLFPWKRDKQKFLHRLTISSKLVLITTFILIFCGALLIFAGDPFSFDNTLSAGDRFFHSLFNSVTARTAGYNTVPIEKLAMTSVLILIVLMWIGASPGGTGGGIKTTTISITLIALFKAIRGKDRVELFKRRIATQSIQKAFLVLLASLVVLSVMSIILIAIEPDKDPINLIFEVTSALGTVGLSRDVTFHLGDGGKLLIVLTMYIGRIGVLTFFSSLVKPKYEARYSLPNEGIMVG